MWCINNSNVVEHIGSIRKLMRPMIIDDVFIETVHSHENRIRFEHPIRNETNVRIHTNLISDLLALDSIWITNCVYLHICISIDSPLPNFCGRCRYIMFHAQLSGICPYTEKIVQQLLPITLEEIDPLCMYVASGTYPVVDGIHQFPDVPNLWANDSIILAGHELDRVIIDNAGIINLLNFAAKRVTVYNVHWGKISMPSLKLNALKATLSRVRFERLNIRITWDEDKMDMFDNFQIHVKPTGELINLKLRVNDKIIRLDQVLPEPNGTQQ